MEKNDGKKKIKILIDSDLFEPPQNVALSPRPALLRQAPQRRVSALSRAGIRHIPTSSCSAEHPPNPSISQIPPSLLHRDTNHPQNLGLGAPGAPPSSAGFILTALLLPSASSPNFALLPAARCEPEAAVARGCAQRAASLTPSATADCPRALCLINLGLFFVAAGVFLAHKPVPVLSPTIHIFCAP